MTEMRRFELSWVTDDGDEDSVAGMLTDADGRTLIETVRGADRPLFAPSAERLAAALCDMVSGLDVWECLSEASQDVWRDKVRALIESGAVETATARVPADERVEA